MKKLFVLVCIFLSVNHFSPLSAEESSRPDDVRWEGLWGDMKDTGNYMWSGFKLQFSQRTNLYWAAAAAPSTWYAFEHDERIAVHAFRHNVDGRLNVLGDMGLVLNLPITHMGLWYVAKKVKNEKLVQFSKEYAATLYMALIESGVMSFIPIHERPKIDELDFSETAFRGESSFPSGHVIPFAALVFTTFHYYGPVASIIPMAMMVGGSMQRIQDGKHWVSDVVGAFWVTAFASEGVRAATGHNNYHPIYKWWAEHDLQVGLVYFQNKGHEAMGPKVSFTF